MTPTPLHRPVTRTWFCLQRLAWGAALAACTAAPLVPESVVAARAELFESGVGALTGPLVMAIKGTYGAKCTNRTGSWAIALNGYTPLASEIPLTVVQGDKKCSLAVTEVKGGEPGAVQSYLPASPFPLAATYAGQRNAFQLGGSGPTQFFANFRVQPDLLYALDFTVQMIYSDRVNQTDLSIGAHSVVWHSTATAGSFPAPTALLSLMSLTISVNAHSVVVTATGSAKLTQGSVTATSYVIDLGTLGPSPSYASVDAVFNSPGKTRVALTGASQAIPAAEFAFVGLDLTAPKKVTVILAHIQNTAHSYQTIEITVQPGATPTAGAGPAPIDLHSAAGFTVLATSGITIGAGGAIVGDVGLTPMAAAGLTGFAPVMNPSGTFSRSNLVTGKVYAANYAAPTPAFLATAKADMQAAYADGAGRSTPDGINLGGGELGGLTILPGLYNWSGAALITTDLTLSGGPKDVWIFQVGGALSMAAAIQVHLKGGAQASNIFWVAVGAVTLGAGAHLEGNVLSQAALSTGAGASINGRLLGQAAVSIGAGSILTQPGLHL